MTKIKNALARGRPWPSHKPGKPLFLLATNCYPFFLGRAKVQIVLILIIIIKTRFSFSYRPDKHQRPEMPERPDMPQKFKLKLP